MLVFSSALGLAFDKVVEEYRLRFQMAFTFRDAKHYWALEDFMAFSATAVTNAANLALCMVSLSAVLLAQLRRTDAHTAGLYDKSATIIRGGPGG